MSKGIDQLFVYDSAQWIFFPFMILFIIWCSFTMGLYLLSSRKFGQSMDIWACCTIGSLITLIINMFMQLTWGITNQWTTFIVFASTITFGLIFILSPRRGQD